MQTHWYTKAKTILKQKGMRYIDIAQALGVTESAVGHYLTGRREPTLEVIRKIAGMCGMSLSELVGEDPRFVVDEKEKQLIDLIRQLSEPEKQAALKIIKALAEPKD
jgi:transcriptional regulator with XRE-family HTH domain